MDEKTPITVFETMTSPGNPLLVSTFSPLWVRLWVQGSSSLMAARAGHDWPGRLTAVRKPEPHALGPYQDLASGR